MQLQLLSHHSHNKMPNIKKFYYAFPKIFFEHVIFGIFFCIICFSFSSTLLFYVCTFSLYLLSTSFLMYISFSFVRFSSIKIKFHFDLIPPFSTRILSSLNEKLDLSMFFAKIIFCQLYENQFKPLQTIEKKKNAMCSINAQCSCANEMQCVKVRCDVYN
jgi:hypothetical protein